MARATTDRPALAFCRIPGTYFGLTLDRGQVVTKPPARNDDQLKRLGYLPDYDGDGDLFVCPECGAEFMADTFRRGHVEKRHRERAAPLPQRQDGEPAAAYAERVAVWKEQQDEIEARRLEREISREAPLIENSLASMRG